MCGIKHVAGGSLTSRAAPPFSCAGRSRVFLRFETSCRTVPSCCCVEGLSRSMTWSSLRSRRAPLPRVVRTSAPASVLVVAAVVACPVPLRRAYVCRRGPFSCPEHRGLPPRTGGRSSPHVDAGEEMFFGRLPAVRGCDGVPEVCRLAVAGAVLPRSSALGSHGCSGPAAPKSTQRCCS